jgi:hypothetical protein
VCVWLSVSVECVSESCRWTTKTTVSLRCQHLVSRTVTAAAGGWALSPSGRGAVAPTTVCLSSHRSIHPKTRGGRKSDSGKYHSGTISETRAPDGVQPHAPPLHAPIPDTTRNIGLKFIKMKKKYTSTQAVRFHHAAAAVQSGDVSKRDTPDTAL